MPSDELLDQKYKVVDNRLKHDQVYHRGTIKHMDMTRYTFDKINKLN